MVSIEVQFSTAEAGRGVSGRGTGCIVDMGDRRSWRHVLGPLWSPQTVGFAVCGFHTRRQVFDGRVERILKRNVVRFGADGSW